MKRCWNSNRVAVLNQMIVDYITNNSRAVRIDREIKLLGPHVLTVTVVCYLPDGDGTKRVCTVQYEIICNDKNRTLDISYIKSPNAPKWLYQGLSDAINRYILHTYEYSYILSLVTEVDDE